MSETPVIHRHTSSPNGALVNAYLVETTTGMVAVDSMLTVSDSRALRQRLEFLELSVDPVAAHLGLTGAAAS